MQSFLQFEGKYGNMETRMKNFFFFCLGSAPFMAFAASGFTAGNIGTTNYSFNPDTIFPSPRKLSTDKGVDNIIDYATNMVGPVTTLMAIGATLMIILGGFYMVMGGADSEQTEKGK